MSFHIQSGPIDLQALRKQLQDPSCGAAVWFEGRVRDHNEGQSVLRLEYEAYEPLCRSEAQRIIEEARQRWPVQRALCVHRSGLLELGEIAVVTAVAAPHRDEAFQAARYIIDEIKHRLPIWKREHYSNGELRWVNCQRCAEAAHRHPHSRAG